MQQYLDHLGKSFDIGELRAFADFVLFKILKLMFLMGQTKEGVDFFDSHYSNFKFPHYKYKPEVMHFVNLY